MCVRFGGVGLPSARRGADGTMLSLCSHERYGFCWCVSIQSNLQHSSPPLPKHFLPLSINLHASYQDGLHRGYNKSVFPRKKRLEGSRWPRKRLRCSCPWGTSLLSLSSFTLMLVWNVYCVRLKLYWWVNQQDPPDKYPHVSSGPPPQLNSLPSHSPTRLSMGICQRNWWKVSPLAVVSLGYEGNFW